MKGKNFKASWIKKLPYSDFVGFINQWNSPPGGFSTISKLATFSRMGRSSKLLEVGCSTGFSSREFALMTGCSGIGVDKSIYSIKMARLNKKEFAPRCNIKYKIADGASLNIRE